MFSPKWIVTTVAGAAALLYAAQDTVAEENGSFKSIAVLTSSYSTLQQFGETAFAGPSEGASVVVESSGDLFMVGGVSEVICVVYGRISATGTSLEAPCTAIAAEVGELYMHSKRIGEVGRTELLGGTGEYEGISGTCDYEVARVTPTVNTVTLKCTWKR